MPTRSSLKELLVRVPLVESFEHGIWESLPAKIIVISGLDLLPVGATQARLIESIRHVRCLSHQNINCNPIARVAVCILSSELDSNPSPPEYNAVCWQQPAQTNRIDSPCYKCRTLKQQILWWRYKAPAFLFAMRKNCWGRNWFFRLSSLSAIHHHHAHFFVARFVKEDALMYVGIHHSRKNGDSTPIRRTRDPGHFYLQSYTNTWAVTKRSQPHLRDFRLACAVLRVIDKSKLSLKVFAR